MEAEFHPAAVSLEAVTKRFGATIAADAISLDIAPGDFTTLLGPSGCGKTTLLRMIAGLLDPDEGMVRIGGRSMAGVAINKRNIGLVFQSYALFPHLSVADNVAFGLRYRNVSRSETDKRVSAMLDLVRLSGRDHAMPGQLSGGQKQRVALARALVIEPDVLLLDEPLSALDAGLREEMRIELRSIQQRLGLTTVFVTHDQGEALAMSDTIAVLRAGRVQQYGAPSDLYNHPATAFVSNFLGFTNILPGKLVSRTADSARVEVSGLGLIEARLGAAAVAVGDPVELAIRAERLQLGSAGEGAAGFAGRIAAVDYQGQSARYLIESGGHSLQAHSFIDSEPLGAGEKVEFSFRPQDCLLFEPEKGTP